MSDKTKRQIHKAQWFYYTMNNGECVAKVNSGELAGAMAMAGFSRCTYAQYLRAKKQLRASMAEKDIILDVDMGKGEE